MIEEVICELGGDGFISEEQAGVSMVSRRSHGCLEKGFVREFI